MSANLVELTDPTDGSAGAHAYEILAFISKANFTTIGTVDVDWFQENIDIFLPLGVINTHGQDESITQNHSFQFYHDAAITWDFWDNIKQETSFDGTY